MFSRSPRAQLITIIKQLKVSCDSFKGVHFQSIPSIHNHVPSIIICTLHWYWNHPFFWHKTSCKKHHSKIQACFSLKSYSWQIFKVHFFDRAILQTSETRQTDLPPPCDIVLPLPTTRIVKNTFHNTFAIVPGRRVCYHYLMKKCWCWYSHHDPIPPVLWGYESWRRLVSIPIHLELFVGRLLHVFLPIGLQSMSLYTKMDDISNESMTLSSFSKDEHTYAPMALGLNENVDDPKWFKILSSAGEGEWLYSGVTHTYPSASFNIEWISCNFAGAFPGGYAK